MEHSLSAVPGSDMLYGFHWPFCSTTSLRNQLRVPYGRVAVFYGMIVRGGLQECSFRKKLGVLHNKQPDSMDDVSFKTETYVRELGDSNLNVQTLRRFPCEKLYGETVLVRFDAKLVLNSNTCSNQSAKSTLSTVKYLHIAGAKVLLASSWDQYSNSFTTKAVADHLSSILQLKVVPTNVISCSDQLKMEKVDATDADIFLLENLAQFKQEIANCSNFAKQLSAGVDIFVNDAFSLAHKVLASTVGIARFCRTSIAGFHFEEELVHLLRILQTTRRPYIAVVGGGNFLEKKAALRLLVSKCDTVVFIGELAFQIMHALGHPVPQRLVDHHSIGEVMEFVQLAHDRNKPLFCPKDFRCVNDCLPEELDTFPADGIIDGWTPVDLGPGSLKEIYSLFLKCKKILWIGPVKFDGSTVDTSGASELAVMLEEMSRINCDVVIVGSAACKAVARTAVSCSSYKYFENASTVWEYLKGRTLPGVAALDRAYPFDLVWDSIFRDPAHPLVVDIGSGNGFFLVEMAQRWRGVNFLGLEINKKLVKHCLENVSQSRLHNAYFLSTNATHTFRSIVSSYHGKLILVSIQCPNPDFNKEDHRWRMVQRPLVEAIIDLLTTNGKVFLQSDVEEVATRMREQFIMHGKDMLVIDGDVDKWIKENPFGVRSDWEQHVIDRGAPMYRVMMRKNYGSADTSSDGLCTFTSSDTILHGYTGNGLKHPPKKFFP